MAIVLELERVGFAEEHAQMGNVDALPAEKLERWFPVRAVSGYKVGEVGRGDDCEPPKAVRKSMIGELGKCKLSGRRLANGSVRSFGMADLLRCLAGGTFEHDA